MRCGSWRSMPCSFILPPLRRSTCLAALLSPVALSVILVLQLLQALHARWRTWCWGFRSASRPSGPISPSRGVSPSNRCILAAAGDDVVRRLRHHLRAAGRRLRPSAGACTPSPRAFRRARRWAFSCGLHAVSVAALVAGSPPAAPVRRGSGPEPGFSRACWCSNTCS